MVRHSIPGRLRVKVKAILFSKERALVLAHWLSQQSEIDKAEARAVTGSVILDEEAYSESGGTVACAAWPHRYHLPAALSSLTAAIPGAICFFVSELTSILPTTSMGRLL